MNTALFSLLTHKAWPAFSMAELLPHGLYLASIVMFILGIMRLGKVKTARSGNMLSAAAMLLAVIGQLIQMGVLDDYTFIIIGLAIGTAVGAVFAIRVPMTGMPEMVALFNGFGGLASTLVAGALYFERHATFELCRKAGTTFYGQPIPEGDVTLSFLFGGIEGTTLYLTLIIGSVTFTGSIIAYAKLSGKLFGIKFPGNAILLPGRHVINALLLLAPLALAVIGMWFWPGHEAAVITIAVVTGLTLLLGIFVVIPIGGGDMPVVISLLNSYSGIAAAMAGFALGEYVLVVTGSLVGASGIILTQIMCKAMNRSLANVMFGGFGAVDSGGGGGGNSEYVGVKSCDAEEAAMIFESAQSCIVVPGYGMAVAQAQHAVRELTELLEKRGCKVRFAIHPVAGRMPGHMNVLLAEANVPYDKLVEMDQINSEFKNTDVSLVIGANDVVNPAAKDDPKSPIYGMPVLNVEDSGTVFVIKRSLGAGFAGIKNTLFEHERCQMIYADAKKATEEITKALKEA